MCHFIVHLIILTIFLNFINCNESSCFKNFFNKLPYFRNDSVVVFAFNERSTDKFIYSNNPLKNTSDGYNGHQYVVCAPPYLYLFKDEKTNSSDVTNFVLIHRLTISDADYTTNKVLFDLFVKEKSTRFLVCSTILPSATEDRTTVAYLKCALRCINLMAKKRTEFWYFTFNRCNEKNCLTVQRVSVPQWVPNPLHGFRSFIKGRTTPKHQGASLKNYYFFIIVVTVVIVLILILICIVCIHKREQNWQRENSSFD